MALVEDEIVAVARFDRMGTTRDAEVAFVVEDGWQGRGLGTALLDRLMTVAIDRGITRFIADTLPINTRMRRVFGHAGRPIDESFEDGVVHVVIPLGTDDRDLQPPAWDLRPY